MSDQSAQFGAKYLEAHPSFADSIELLGLDAVIDINKVVGGVRRPDSIGVTPGFTPQAIHR
jgi:hypothetical protein